MSKEMNTDTVGARIREKRKDKGFSQEKLADLLMIKQTTLSKYENDEHDIPIAVLSAVAKHLDTTPSYLVWGSEEDEGWLSELRMIAGSIRNPMVRETALKQMLALAWMDENM
jgi:transcriptional regulator with XRE-family HTH domain